MAWGHGRSSVAVRHGFARARQRGEFADLALMISFLGGIVALAWQALRSLSQSALHCFSRESQYSTLLPRAIHCALRLPQVTLQASNFSVHLSTFPANTIIKALESASSAMHIFRFMPKSFEISAGLVQQNVSE